jgi:hypothetical protein
VLSAIIVYGFVSPSWEAAPLEGVPFDERVKAALDIRKEATKTVFEVTFLLLGGIWGLFLATEGGERGAFSRTWPDRLMFALANVLFVGSVIFGGLYSIGLSETLVDSTFVLKGKAESPAAGGAEKAGGVTKAATNAAGRAPEKEEVQVPDFLSPSISWPFWMQIGFFSAGVAAAAVALINHVLFRRIVP